MHVSGEALKSFQNEPIIPPEIKTSLLSTAENNLQQSYLIGKQFDPKIHCKIGIGKCPHESLCRTIDACAEP